MTALFTFVRERSPLPVFALRFGAVSIPHSAYHIPHFR